ncbi:MAG: hypothetical protein R3F58_07545 [Steroidobacteraceae bacterium]|nr:hypothetical protein [Steroidobacteraceae bacterium]
MSDPSPYPPPKGHRPYFFDDPAIDQLHTALLAVTQELSVARERIDTLERLLEQSGHLRRAAIETFQPDASAEAERTVQRAALVDRVLKPFVDYRENLFSRKRGQA